MYTIRGQLKFFKRLLMDAEFEFHIVFMCHKIKILLLVFQKSFKSVKSILSSQATQKCCQLQFADPVSTCLLDWANQNMHLNISFECLSPAEGCQQGLKEWDSAPLRWPVDFFAIRPSTCYLASSNLAPHSSQYWPPCHFLPTLSYFFPKPCASFQESPPLSSLLSFFHFFLFLSLSLF